MRFLLLPFLICCSVSAFGQTSNDTLRVAYAQAAPFVIDEHGHLEGISIWLWKRCAKELELEYQLVPMSLQSMLDSLQTGRIDVSINPLTITSQRFQHIRFTQPFFASHSIVVKPNLTAFQRVQNFFEKFFSITFLSGFIFLLFLIFVFAFLIWYFERQVEQNKFRDDYKGIWDGLWWSVVTMTTVGYGDKTPQSRGGKVVALVWMFSGLLFISGLTASVASSLTVDSLTIDQIDVKKYKTRAIGTVNHSSTQHYLNEHFFKNVTAFEDVSSGLDAVLQHRLDAFVYDEPILQYYLLNHSKYANLEVLSQKFKEEFYAFGVPKTHTKLADRLSQKIVDIKERQEWQFILSEYGCGEK